MMNEAAKTIVLLAAEEVAAWNVPAIRESKANQLIVLASMEAYQKSARVVGKVSRDEFDATLAEVLEGVSYGTVRFKLYREIMDKF